MPMRSCCTSCRTCGGATIRGTCVLRLVQALYWPHPLVWLLGRAIAEVRERACDDLCVHELGGPSAYRRDSAGRRHRACRIGPGPALGLAMARPSRLGRRLARIDESRGDARCLPRRPARLAIAAMAVAASALLGRDPAHPCRGPADRARRTRDRIRQTAQTGPAADGGGRVFHLQVVAADTGQPVPNADVRVWIALRDEWRKTDAEGRLDIAHSTGPADRALRRRRLGRRPRDAAAPLGTRPEQADPRRRRRSGSSPASRSAASCRTSRGGRSPGRRSTSGATTTRRRTPTSCSSTSAPSPAPTAAGGPPAPPRRPANCSASTSIHPDYLSTRDYSDQGDHPEDRRPPRRQGRDGDEEGRADRGPGGRRRRQAGRRGDGPLRRSSQGDLCDAEVDQFAVIDRRRRPFPHRAGQGGRMVPRRPRQGARPGRAGASRSARPSPRSRSPRPPASVLRARRRSRTASRSRARSSNVDTWRGYRCLGVFL